MTVDNIHNCLVTLDEGYSGYSPRGRRMLFGNRFCNHILPYKLHDVANRGNAILIENQTRISISGVQEKYSMKLHKKQLVATDIGGTYILKPPPHSLEYAQYVPINEHLTMLIASQVFGINTARCGLVLFSDGEAAYITRRFDVLKDGNRCLKEDFASAMQITPHTHGTHYKYNSSYFEMCLAIDQFIPAAMIEKEKLFALIVYNYLISNGDAHLKNFSVISYDMAQPFYVLAPAYDLLCTALHMNDTDISMDNGLFAGDYNEPGYSLYGYYTYDEFYQLGLRAGLLPVRVQRILKHFCSKEQEVENLVAKSFLSAELKVKYIKLYRDKQFRLRQSFTGLV